MQLGDLATWVSGTATMLVMLFAGLELRQMRRREAEDRRMELTGVAVEWRLAGSPAPPTPDGDAESEYIFTLYNPGRLPVTHVDIEVCLPLDVRLVRGDGSEEGPLRSFRLDTPVVAGQGSREWWRTCRFAYADRGGLRDITATVHFRDLDGHEHQTRWGRPHHHPAHPTRGPHPIRARQTSRSSRSRSAR